MQSTVWFQGFYDEYDRNATCYHGSVGNKGFLLQNVRSYAQCTVTPNKANCLTLE